MKTLVIPDIHENGMFRRAVEAQAETADAVVCLGDYFDKWGGLDYETNETIDWVKSKLTDSKWTMLLGNHDMHYLFANRGLLCSGYTPERKKQIMDADLTMPPLRNHFKLFTFVEGWFLSHAGFPVWPANMTPELMTAEASLALGSAAAFGRLHPWLQAGQSRGGDAKVGGLTWADMREHERLIAENSFGPGQICGHTHLKGEPAILTLNHAFTAFTADEEIHERYFIDTEAHVAWIENGAVTIERVLPAETQRPH